MKIQQMMRLAAVVALLLCVGQVWAKEPKQNQPAIRQKLERVTQACDQAMLRANFLMWESYLEYARRTESMIDMSKFKERNLRALCDSIPALGVLRAEYDEAYKAWQEVLRTDPEYESIHEEYVSLKGITDREKTTANTQRYNLMYDRLRRDNPAYKPALEVRDVARGKYHHALLVWLLDDYRAQGRPMPFDKVIDYRLQRTLRQEFPAIEELNRQVAILQKLQRELEESLLRLEYGVEKSTEEPVVRGFGAK